MLLAFWGVWGAYQSHDDIQAHEMVRRVNAEATGPVDKFYHLLTFSHSRAHWTPVSNLILYPALVNDSNTRIVLINLVVLAVASILAGRFSKAMGADFWPALFCSIWIASSQVLVFPVATCWGTLNMLPPVFTMAGAWLLWRWLNKTVQYGETSKIRWQLLFAFTAFLTLAVLTKETGIRGLALAAGTAVIALIYRCDLPHRKEALALTSILVGWIVLYFLIRYVFTEAAVPLLRPMSDSRYGAGYQQLRLDYVNNIKNIATILLGSLNPVNSYATYLKITQKEYLKAALFILPAVSWGIALLTGWGALTIKDTKQNRPAAVFIALLVLCSLFPEFLLGKVSEMYSMASLWPLAILSAIVLTRFRPKKKTWLHYVLVLVLSLFIVSNICSARAKVREILETGRNVHGIRQSMMELTKDLPNNSKIAIILKPRPKKSFARFGERGVLASGMCYGSGRFGLENFNWKRFNFGEPVPKPQQFDLILRESEDQSRLEVVDTKKAGL